MINKISIPAAVLLYAAVSGLAFAQQQTRTPIQGNIILVLQGGLLIDGTGGPPLQDSVVAIADGKIQSVGRRGAAAPVPGATVIDTTGKTIIPGLVDSHVHFRNAAAQLYLYWGVTSVGDMGNNLGWILAYQDAVRKGRTQGPFIMATGPLIYAPPIPGDRLAFGERFGFRPEQFLDGNGYAAYVTDEASLEKEISDLQKAGVDAVKLYLRLGPARLKAGAQIAHRYGLPAFSHYTTASARTGTFIGTDEVLDTGIDAHVHLFGLVKATAPKEIRDRIAGGEDVDAWHLLNVDRYPPLIQRMVKNNMFLNPTLGNQFSRYSKFRDEWDRFNTSFMAGPMGKNLLEITQRRYLAAYKPRRDENINDKEEGYRRAGLFVKEFADAGGKVIAGVDSGAGAQPVGISLHVEMQMLNESGMKPMQVLQSATSWAMEAWGKSKEVGTIEAGKRADIVILNRNPLEDIRATRDIDRVIQAGRIIDRDGLVNSKESLARPTPMQPGPENPLLHIPFINSVVPDSIPLDGKGTVEVIVNGENFTQESLVLFNNRLLSTKFYSDKQLGVRVQSTFKEEGTYPFVVVRPGPGGGTSNNNYLIVVRK